MTIMIYPAPVLRQVAKQVVNFGTPQLKNLVDRMFSIMAEKNGAGLAAPQINESVRVIVYGSDKINLRYPDAPIVRKDYAINPEIIWHSEEEEDGEEGCLSFPGQRGIVSRPKSIIFSSFDLDGNRRETSLSGFAARVILHERDHLEGVLLVDKATKLRNTR